MQKEQITRGNVIVDIVIDTAEACRAVELKINGVKAILYDFGTSKDIDPDNAPPCGCGNRVFTMKHLKKSTLEKYHLSEDDIEDLSYILTKKFSVGFCRRCK